MREEARTEQERLGEEVEQSRFMMEEVLRAHEEL